MKTHFQLSKITTALAVMGSVSLFAGQAFAVAPLAGSNISNVATATYTDNTGTERVVTSNEVKTIVAQVGSFTLEDDRAAQTTPNGQVTYSHILTNTGNGTDKFKVSLTDIDSDTNTFNFSNGGKFAVYIDRNKDGVADDQIALKPTDLIELAAGESVGLVVVASTPSTAQSGQKDELMLTVTVAAKDQVTYLNLKDENIDTTTITNGAVMQITKAASVSTAEAGDEITYTLTFKNTGNAAANNVAIFDVLPETVEYVANSAHYNGSSTALTDTDTDSDNFKYDSSKRAFLFNIGSVAANTTGKLTFKVKVKATASAGQIKNIAYVDPDGKDGKDLTDIPNLNDPTNPLENTTVPSNPSIVTVVGTFNGSINDTTQSFFPDKQQNNLDYVYDKFKQAVYENGEFIGYKLNEGVVLNGDDKITENALQGKPVIFGGVDKAVGDKIVVHNSGNTTDAFNLFVSNSTLPTGSIIEILKADGKTPAVDTNGDGIIDTGPIAPNTYVEFVVRVTVPNDQDPAGKGVILNSTSVKTAVNDTLSLIIGTVGKNAVDLVSNTSEGTKGKGSPTDATYGDEIVDKKITPPGSKTTFDITIENKGNVPDNYIINVPGIPEGWTVEIFEKDEKGECTGNKVTNSGNIYSPNSLDENGEKIKNSKSFCVEVTPPAGTKPSEDIGSTIKVEISSPSTGTKDNIKFEVFVAEQRGLSFTPDRQGQVAPGGTIVYNHILKNTGNVTEGDRKYPLMLEWTSTLNNSNTSVYIDINNDGLISDGELVTFNSTTDKNGVTTYTVDQETLMALLVEVKSGTNVDGESKPANVENPRLEPGESVNILVKVEAPATATAGESDTSVVKFTSTASIPHAKFKDVEDYKLPAKPADVKITDRTVINLGQVRLLKQQAVESCSLTESTSLKYSTDEAKAAPGSCVYYKITATNDGNEIAKSVVIQDSVPSYTTFKSGSLKPVDLATESNGQVTYVVGTLTPAQSVALEFAVKIDESETSTVVTESASK